MEGPETPLLKAILYQVKSRGAYHVDKNKAIKFDVVGERLATKQLKRPYSYKIISPQITVHIF